LAGTLEFYFDYGSPYLADTQAEAIAKRGGATSCAIPCCWAAATTASCSSRRRWRV